MSRDRKERPIRFDMPGKLDNGFSFVRDPRNELQPLFTQVLRDILQSTSFHTRQLDVSGQLSPWQAYGSTDIYDAIQGRFTWDRQKLHQWLKVHDSLNSKLLWLVEWTGAGAGRGTETAVLLLTNTVCERSFFIDHGQAVLVPEYNKSMTRNNRRFVTARYLDNFTSSLMIFYAAFVRPIHDYLRKQQAVLAHRSSPSAMAIDGEEAHTDSVEPLLFVREGRPYKDSEVWATVEAHSQKFVGSNLGTREIRQYQAALFRNKYRMAPMYEGGHVDTSGGLLEHAIFGHHSRTHESQYGKSDDDFRSLTPEKLLAFYYTSQAMHAELGLEGAEPLRQPAPTGAKPAVQGALGPIHVHVDTASLSRDILSHLALASERGPAHRDRLEKGVPVPGDRAYLMVRCLGAAVGGSADARPRSHGQALALQHIIEAKRDMLVILPTGERPTLSSLIGTDCMSLMPLHRWGQKRPHWCCCAFGQGDTRPRPPSAYHCGITPQCATGRARCPPA
jgi:hypothetical protein